MRDLTGRTCYQSTENLQLGENQMHLPLAHLAAGTYLLQLQTEEGLLTRKVVKTTNR